MNLTLFYFPFPFILFSHFHFILDLGRKCDVTSHRSQVTIMTEEKNVKGSRIGIGNII